MNRYVFVMYLSVLYAGFVRCAPMQTDAKQLIDTEKSEKIDEPVCEIITTKVGEEFFINLQSNPTTGYSWRLALQTFDPIVSAVKKEYVKSAHNQFLAGAGGFDTWTFKALKPGTTAITLEYLRPWKPDEIVKRVVIEATVEPASE